MARYRLLLAAAVIAAGAAAGAFAQSITEFPVPIAGSNPFAITAGPDGNLWYTELGGNRIGRLTPSGVFTEFAIPGADGFPTDITAAGDGNLWFVEYGEFFGSAIWRITPAGVVTRIVEVDGSLNGIAVGPDGHVWSTRPGTSANAIIRITMAGSVTDFPIPTAGAVPTDITAGPDGNLWFTERGTNKIGRITTAGAITEFTVPTPSSQPTGITAGPDGNLWFTEQAGNQIGRITPGGAITEFPIPSVLSEPRGIAAGPDGNLWFTENGANQIGRITTTGGITEFAVPTPASRPDGITAGPDGNIWFTEVIANKIGRLAIPVGPASEVRIIPVVGSIAGVSSTFFRTAVQLHNSTSTPSAGRIVFHRSGTVGADGDPALSYTLSPGQTQSIADLLPAMGLAGLGSADIVVTAGAVPVTTARVFNDAGSAGTSGFTEESLGAEDVLSAGQRGALIIPSDLVGFRLNIGVRTLLAGASATFSVRTAAGVAVASVTRVFPPTYHEQQAAYFFLFSEIVTIPPGVFSIPAGGSITIAVNAGSVIVYGATVDNRTGDPSLQIAAPAP